MQSFYNSTRSASNSSLVVASGMFSSGRVSFKEKYSVFFLFLNPLHPYISMQILYTSPKVMTRKYILTSSNPRASLVGDHFLYSCDHSV